MSVLSSLKLVSVKRPAALPGVVLRRNRLLAKIWEQSELAKAQQAGKTFAPTHVRKVVDRVTGVQQRVEAPKRVRAWWWTGENGKLFLNLRYGARTIEISKGKTAIEIDTLADLILTLDLVKSVVLAGELDTQIDAVSSTMRLRLPKKR